VPPQRLQPDPDGPPVVRTKDNINFSIGYASRRLDQSQRPRRPVRLVHLDRPDRLARL
jgi:hypothetical protein